MGVIWRRGICGGFYTGFFDSGENGEQSSQTSCSGPHRIFDNQAKFNAEEERGSREPVHGSQTRPLPPWPLATLVLLRVKNMHAGSKRTVRRALP